MRLTIVGAGYVGLVAAACFADQGHHVTVVERDPTRVAQLEQGRAPFHEPGLEALLHRTLQRGTLSVTRDITAVAGAAVVFLAVGTPSGEDGGADDSHLVAAAAEVARALDGPTLLVCKSTAPVGTCRRLEALARELSPHPVQVVANPEFLREGAAVADFLHPVRIVLGTASADAAATLRALYSPFASADRVKVMDPASAELTKYASNAMLAMRVAFVNDLAALCAAHGADIGSLTDAMGADPRIGPAFLQPSLGFGGSCLPKDVRALAAMGREAGVPQALVEAADEANAAQRRRWLDRIRTALGGLQGRTVAVWGLAFKAGTDDVRESAALALALELVREGATVRAHDPLVRTCIEGIEVTTTPHAALEGADALLIGTDWPGYQGIDCAVPVFDARTFGHGRS